MRRRLLRPALSIGLLVALGLAGCQPSGGGCSDTCRFARDGECDEAGRPGAVTGLCDPGTDCTDCGGSTPPRDASRPGTDGGAPPPPVACAWNPPAEDVRGPMAPLAGGDMLIMRHSADWLRIPCDGSDPVSLAPLADFRTHTRPLRQMADGRLFIGESDLTSSFGGSWLSPDPTLSEVPIEGVSYRLPDDDGTVWSSESGTADVIGYDESGARRHQVASAGFLVATLESGFVMADLGGTGNDSIYCHADPDAAPTELTGAATFEGDPLLYSRMTIPATRDGVFLLPFGTYSGYSGSGPGCRNALRGKLAAFTCADGHRFDIPFRAPGNGSSCLTLRGPYVQRTTGGDFVAYANADVSPGVSLGSTTSGGVVGVFDASSGAERWTRAVGLAEAAAGPNDTVWVAHEEGVAVYDAPTGALLAGNAPSN